MTDLTRRGFVKGSAGAAAGMTMLSALLAESAEAHAEGAHSEAVVAYVRNPRTGEVWIMAKGREFKVHDRKLAARIARAGH